MNHLGPSRCRKDRRNACTVLCMIGLCFPLSQVLPLVLEASSQGDEGTRAVACGSVIGSRGQPG